MTKMVRAGLATLSAAAIGAGLACGTTARAGAPAAGFLAGIHHQMTLTSTIPSNGDQNPYAVVVAPVSAGTIKQGDVLVDNFNDKGNLQGKGSTIVDYDPATKTMKTFATVPNAIAGCPGGVGLTTAMAMLKTGWVIVGSMPSTDGTTATKGKGCLIVLDPNGKVVGTITSPHIDGPWGNMAVIDDGGKATIFLSNTGFDVGAPLENTPVVKKANILRLEFTTSKDKAPTLVKDAVIADGFGEQADKGVFVIGPTGLALDDNGTLYVSNALDNEVVAIPNAVTRTDSAGTGTIVTKGEKLQRPLALAVTPGGHLLAANGLDGQVVEIDPSSGKQIGTYWADTDKAQTPPGSGDLFGLAIMPSGKGFYYVEDDVNTLAQAD